MFSTNRRISKRQVKRMLILDMFSVSFLIIPYIIVRSYGEEGWFPLILGGIFAIFYGTILYYFGIELQEESYMSYARKSIGKIGAILLGGLYFIKFFMVFLFAVTLFIHIISHTLLIDTNIKVILIVLLVVSGYGGIQGLEKKARFAEFIYYIVLIPIGIYLLIGLFRVDIGNLMLPGKESNLIGENFFIKSENNLIWSSYITLLSFTALETLLFILPSVNKKEKRGGIYSYIIGSILMIGILNILIYCITVGILGVGETGNTLWGVVTIMTLIELPGELLNRQDGIMLAFWLLSIYILLSAYWFYMVHILDEMIQCCSMIFSSKERIEEKLKKGRKEFLIGIFILVLTYISYGLITNIQEAFVTFGKYFAYIGLPQSILIPVVLFTIQKIKNRNRQGIQKEKKTL